MNNENATPPQVNNPIYPSGEPVDKKPPKPVGKYDGLKRTFLQILIACLIGAAIIAVFTVLSGSFNDVLSKSLVTIFLVAIHAALILSKLSGDEKKELKYGPQSIELFDNTVFVIIALSFITSVFSTWKLISGDLTMKLYLSYGVILFATLHADVLYRIRKIEHKIDTIVTINYFIMSIVSGMLFIIIFSGTGADLGEMFYRILAAFGIVDTTLTITSIIMHKLYVQKNPSSIPDKSKASIAQSQNYWKNPLVVLLILYMAFQAFGVILNLIYTSIKK